MKRLSNINEETRSTKASYEYKDIGCKISHSCLNCPLEYCKYDNKNTRRKLRNKNIIELSEKGTSLKEISAIHNIGCRQLHRILKGRKASKTNGQK